MSIFIFRIFILTVLYSFQQTNISNPLLRSFDSFWLSLADKVTTGTYNFVSLIVKIILQELALALSAPAADKTQYFVHLRFNTTLQLINGILRDLQKLLKYFNSAVIAAFFKIPFVPSTSVFSNNLSLYSKDLKLLLLAISTLKLVPSSLE